MHWRALTDRETLGAWDCVDKDGNPRDLTLEISRVVAGVAVSAEKPKGDRRPFIYFRGPNGKEGRKPLVCGSTNAKTIATLAGSNHIEKWIGLRVTLYPTTTKVKGELVDCIRIRPRKATGPVEHVDDDKPVDEAMRAKQRAAMDRPDEDREPKEEG